MFSDSTRAAAAQDTAEQLWQQGDSLLPRDAVFGFQIARAAHDSVAVFRWLDRIAPSEHDALWYRYEALARHDVRYRDALLERIRSLIASYQRPNDRYRGLQMTAVADERERADFARQALVSLGELLLERGDTAAALDTLRRTIDDGWDVQRFERVATMYLRTRDTANAARVYALVVSDPATPAEHAKVLSQTFEKAIGTDRWTRLAADANHEMTRRVMAGAITRALPKDISITDEQGIAVQLASVTQGRA